MARPFNVPEGDDLRAQGNIGARKAFSIAPAPWTPHQVLRGWARPSRKTMRQVGELTLSPRSLKLKLQSLVEMLVTLGFLTDVLSSALLAPFASLSNPLGS